MRVSADIFLDLLGVFLRNADARDGDVCGVVGAQL